MSKYNPINFFGYEISKKIDKQDDTKEQSKPQLFFDTDDEAEIVPVGAGRFGHYVDTKGDNVDQLSEKELIYKYRATAQHPEVDMAVSEIADEAISTQPTGAQVSVVLDSLPYNDTIKTHITNEFKSIIKKLQFSNKGTDLFRQWYVDGKIYCHIEVGDKVADGLTNLTILDPTCLKKVREVEEETDRTTGVVLKKTINIYYIYTPDDKTQHNFGVEQEIRLPEESIVCIKSGLMDPHKKKVISHIHKALKPINQLRIMEDSLVIYRLARAPERRIFYIDTGNLPPGKAEEYVRKIMSRYRNNVVYDAQTGEIKDQRKHMSMLEDFWLPRQEGGRGTEIDTLPGGDNLGQIDDIIYFKEQVYKSLNVPFSRVESDNGFTSGRATEINREEVKFHKFVNRLRRQFSKLFIELLGKQLLLKSIVHKSDWDDIVSDIQFNFNQDNHFFELLEFEVLQDRLNLMSDLENSVGKYFSHAWIQRNVLKLTDDDITAMRAEIQAEKEEGFYESGDEF